MHKQRGISLIMVAIVSAALAGLAMAALYSMRYERNVFAEAWARITGQPASQAVLQQSQEALKAAGVNPGAAAAAVGAAAPAGVLRKCIINGKTVLSDVDCSDRNPTSKVVEVHQTHGIESPKMPQPEPAASTTMSAQDRAIEKATQ